MSFIIARQEWTTMERLNFIDFVFVKLETWKVNVLILAILNCNMGPINPKALTILLNILLQLLHILYLDYGNFCGIIFIAETENTSDKIQIILLKRNKSKTARFASSFSFHRFFLYWRPTEYWPSSQIWFSNLSWQIRILWKMR